MSLIVTTAMSAALALTSFEFSALTAQGVETPAPSDIAAQGAPASQISPPADTGPVVFEDLSDQEILARVVAHIEDIKTLEARFSQFSSGGSSASGVVKLKRPGLMKFVYDPPTPLNIVANNGLVYVEDTELETTDTYPVRETPLKFLLRRKVDAEDLQLLGVDRGADRVTLTLTSNETEVEGSIALMFNAPELELRQWVIYEPDGRNTFVSLSDVRTGIDIKNREFRAPETSSRLLKDR